MIRKMVFLFPAAKNAVSAGEAAAPAAAAAANLMDDHNTKRNGHRVRLPGDHFFGLKSNNKNQETMPDSF